MRRKRKQRIDLISLYFSYIFHKASVWIFSIACILMILSLYLISDPWMDKDAYLMDSSAFHMVYFNQSLFVLSLFNGIFMTTVVITLSIHSVSFDSLFISTMKRRNICISKIIASSILILFLSMFEYIVLYGIPLIRYKEYKMESLSYLFILGMFLSIEFDFLISMGITTIVKSIFAPMVYLFLIIVKSFLVGSMSKVTSIFKPFIPIFSYTNQCVCLDSMYILPLWCILFGLLYYSMYSILDLK